MGKSACRAIERHVNRLNVGVPDYEVENEIRAVGMRQHAPEWYITAGIKCALAAHHKNQKQYRKVMGGYGRRAPALNPPMLVIGNPGKRARKKTPRLAIGNRRENPLSKAEAKRILSDVKSHFTAAKRNLRAGNFDTFNIFRHKVWAILGVMERMEGAAVIPLIDEVRSKAHALGELERKKYRKGNPLTIAEFDELQSLSQYRAGIESRRREHAGRPDGSQMAFGRTLSDAQLNQFAIARDAIAETSRHQGAKEAYLGAAWQFGPFDPSKSGLTRRGNPKMDRGIHVEYLPANQAWALMWFNQILGLFDKKADAKYEAAILLRKKNPIVADVVSGAAFGAGATMIDQVLRGKNPGTLPARIANDPKFKAALKDFRKRHGTDPIEIRKIKVPKGYPQFLVPYGRAPEVKYDAMPYSNKGRRIHHFGSRKGNKKNHPWLVTSPERGPKFLAYVGGTFAAKPDWLFY